MRLTIAFLPLMLRGYNSEIEEVKELHSLSSNLFFSSKINTSMQWQKAKMN